MSKYDWLADRLPYIRNIVGVTAENFAEFLGVTRMTYNKIECKHSEISTLYYNALFNVIKSLSVDDPLIWTIITILMDDINYYSKEASKFIIDTIDKTVSIHKKGGRGIVYKQNLILEAFSKKEFQDQLRRLIFGDEEA